MHVIQYSTIQYNILYWSLLLGKLPFLPRAYINLHTDYMEIKLCTYIASEICITVRDTWSKSIWQAHRAPQALWLKTVTACGTNEFEYVTVLAFATLILPLRTISRLSKSCLKGCVMSCSSSLCLCRHAYYLTNQLSYIKSS